ncbi:MAG: BrnA antitoxin family protein [Rhodanobacteraceae bacterium]
MRKAKSQTDWTRVKREAKTDAPIPHSPEENPYDPNNPAAVNRYWDSATVRPRGPQKSPTKERITIRLSREVVEYFRGTGDGWQSRIDESLKALVRKRAKK